MNYKCKQCRSKKPNDGEMITNGVNRFCSKSCRRTFTAEANKKKREKEKVKKVKARKKKAESVSVLKKKLWTIVSLYIRLRDSDDDNYCTCCTCGERRHYKDSMQAGHYIASGQSSYHRYNPKNIHSQCYGCNVGKNGNVLEYQKFMIGRYGKDYTEGLFNTRNFETKLGAMEIKQHIDYYEDRLYNIKLEKCID